MPRFPDASVPGALRLGDYVGTAIFAVTGSLAAAARGMDVLGATVVGTVTAVGGPALLEALTAPLHSRNSPRQRLWPAQHRQIACSVLRQAHQAAQELVDRTYRVTLSNPNDQALEQELTLNIRGGSKFVLRPVDGSYIMGSDGSQFWMARPDGPVWVTSNYRALAPALRRRIPNRRILGLATSPNKPFLLDITELLSLIKRKYEIELINPSGTPEHHIRATLRSEVVNVPEKIEFWTDADTGVVIKAKTYWPDQNIRTLELLNSEPLNPNWYQYPLHAPNAEARRL